MDKIKKMWRNLSLRKSIILYISAFVILAILLSAGTATLCNNATKTIESKYPPTGEKYYLTNENGERLGDGNYIGVAPVAMSEKDQRLLSICEVAPIIATPIYSALCIITATLLFYRNKLKKPLTKNEYKQVHTDDYILEDGQHEGIVSEELWQKAHTKRMATGIKQPSKIGKDRSHLLTGILKCPICGSSMYTNKHAWTNKDGTYKEVYYYICGRNKQERGHHCDYKASLRKTDIEPLVIEAVKELVSDKYFAKEIEKRIGVQTDTTAIDKELANYESKLKEVDLNKARLEREIDNLPIDARFRERKIHDMTLRLDGLYDTIVELEERIEDAKLRRSSIEMEAITLDNIYKLMLNFGKLYDIISDEEKKNLITYLIKEIQIYPNGESEMPLKSIEFNFPIYRDGQEVRRLLWEKGNTVETVVLLSQLK